MRKPLFTALLLAAALSSSASAAPNNSDPSRLAQPVETIANDKTLLELFGVWDRCMYHEYDLLHENDFSAAQAEIMAEGMCAGSKQAMRYRLRQIMPVDAAIWEPIYIDFVEGLMRKCLYNTAGGRSSGRPATCKE